MVGFYKAVLVALGVSVATSSLIDIDLDLDSSIGGCSRYNEAARKEWYVFDKYFETNRLTYYRGELTPDQRTEYTNAVLCMQKQPQQLPREEFPGVRNRFDDFVAYVLAADDTQHELTDIT